MKKPLFFSLFLLLQLLVVGQNIRPEDEKILQQKEDSLKIHALKLINGNSANIRFESDSIFTKIFVRALKMPNSFYYPFDSLETISKLYAPDNSFRIFTWQMVVNENLVRQHGAIQMNTKDGSLKLFPLVDKSDVTTKVADTIGDNKGWIGAVYYKMIETKNNDQTFYTLLGYDENNIRSNRKIIEVLSFNDGVPTFGGRYFSFDQDTVKKRGVSRYIMEYKKDAGPRLTYDNDLQMIVFEHMESETNEPNKKWTYVPDGDYEGFKWVSGKWMHVEKLFNQITAEGKEPVPAPVKDAEGNTMEELLRDNMSNEKEKADTPVIKPAAKPKAVKQKKKGNL